MAEPIWFCDKSFRFGYSQCCCFLFMLSSLYERRILMDTQQFEVIRSFWRSLTSQRSLTPPIQISLPYATGFSHRTATIFAWDPPEIKQIFPPRVKCAQNLVYEFTLILFICIVQWQGHLWGFPSPNPHRCNSIVTFIFRSILCYDVSESDVRRNCFFSFQPASSATLHMRAAWRLWHILSTQKLLPQP